jgi:putative transposase
MNEANTMDIMTNILDIARKNGIWIDHVNGHKDHVHCLISLRPEQSLADLIKHLKGESSRWINMNLQLDQPFHWAEGYFASSVSIQLVPKIRHYITNQPIHHQTKTWELEEQEYDHIIQPWSKPPKCPR